MSNELIGELGLVGLTIPKKRTASEREKHATDTEMVPVPTVISPTPTLETDPLAEPLMSSSSPLSPELPEKGDKGEVEENNSPPLLSINDKPSALDVGVTTSSRKPRVSKKFRSIWMTYALFKEWLQPNSDPEMATCSVCNRVIRAGKSELEKHASAKRHVEMMNKKMVANESRPVTESDQLLTGCLIQRPPSSDVFAGADREPISNGQPVADNSLSAENTADSTGTSTFGGQYATGVLAPVQKTLLLVPQEAPAPTPTKAAVLRMAPHWKATAIVNGHVTKLDLHDYRGRTLILVFYPQDFAKLCANELNRLSDRIEQFRSKQADIVACSTDSHLAHLAWLKRPRTDNGVPSLKIPLLADPTQTICRDYGVYLPDKGHALRAHFIIDGRGVIRHITINDPLVGRGTDDMLRIVDALQSADDFKDDSELY